MGISSPAFEKKKEDQSVFLVYAVFQVPLTRFYAEVAYFGIASSVTLQCMCIFAKIH